jgi:hypothetical protein
MGHGALRGDGVVDQNDVEATWPVNAFDPIELDVARRRGSRDPGLG